jgi:hypothetical protein
MPNSRDWLAQVNTSGIDPNVVIANIKSQILNPLIALGFAVALLVFLWGVYESIRDSKSDVGRQTGAQHMLWGIIGLAIMVSAFGLVNLICSTIGCR